jgi:hypothetical protein
LFSFFSSLLVAIKSSCLPDTCERCSHDDRHDINKVSIYNIDNQHAK